MTFCRQREMDTLWDHHTSDVVDRPTQRNIVDSKLVFYIKDLTNASIDKFNAGFMAKIVSQLQGTDYHETFALVVCFDLLRLL
jgi:hypothetical protein